MTDEEKKAIEYIKNCLDNEYNYKNATRQKDKKAYNIILNLIQKQSKEIEELKQEKEYLNCIIESDKDNYINKDKIKAKIEEIDKILNEDIYSIEGHYDDRYYRYLQDRHVLQSLLEKE